MKVQGKNTNAYEAAGKFAASFDEAREVNPDSFSMIPGGGLEFRLVGGARWYRVTILDDYSGWDVSPVGSAVSLF